MMPHRGRNFEEEMSRFEAEINAARAQQAFMTAGPGGLVQLNPAHTTSGPISNFARSMGSSQGPSAVISAPPSGAVISAPPSNSAVISAPPKRSKDDEDILAILEKAEKEVKSETKQFSKQNQFQALQKDVANKKARMMAENVKKSTTVIKNNPNPAAPPPPPGAPPSTSQNQANQNNSKTTPVVASISDETVKKAKMKKRIIRTGGGQVWEDDTLKDWDQTDFRIFCGDLGNDVTDEVLARTFGRYTSFQKAKVIRDKRTNKTKGFGFISFKDPSDFTRAMREMNGKYIGSRPIKMRKSNWKDRNIEVVKTKIKEKQKMGYKY